MKVLQRALFATLILLLPSADPVSFVGKAAAQAQEKSREALYMKCRNEVFRKYGSRENRDGRRKLVMLSHVATSVIDQCVANGGRPL
jgi:hypothetical protein